LGEEKWVKVWAEKPKMKRPLLRLRCRWEDNIKVNLKEIGLDFMVHLFEDRNQ
jgi:hypothetical protein